MLKSGFVCFVFMVPVLVALAAPDQRSAGKSNPVVLEYLGTAGWEITDGTNVILIDPYLSRINGPAPPGGGSGHSMAGDTRRAYGWNDVASPDVAVIDSHIQRADFVLVTHTHYDHVLDVPHIALTTGAAVIGTESTENVMRAYDVPKEQLITVLGGEDYQFGSFSLKSFPAFTALWTTSTTLVPLLPLLE
jgi:L-ascorbate metabolism protein UlaG (beta-lactamase superfamily)